MTLPGQICPGMIFLWKTLLQNCLLLILVVSVKWDFLDFLQKYIFVLLITGFISIHLSTEKIAFAWDRNRVVLIITTVEAYA